MFEKQGILWEDLNFLPIGADAKNKAEGLNQTNYLLQNVALKILRQALTQPTYLLCITNLLMKPASIFRHRLPSTTNHPMSLPPYFLGNILCHLFIPQMH